MNIRMIALAALAAGSALATDAALLGLIPPDAKVVAGIRVTQAIASPLGQFVLSHLPAGGDGFDKMVGATGFDPRHDVSEILIASSAPSNHNAGLIAVRGVFDPARIESAAAAHGSVKSSLLGVTVFTANGAQIALALPNATTAVFGDLDSVKAAIGRYRGKTGPGDDLQKKLQTASLDSSGAPNDVWFVTLAPLSEMLPQQSAAGGGNQQNMNMFQAVQQASAGIRFTAENVRLAAQFVARSDKDAQSISDVFRFLVTMLQSNRQKSQMAGAMASLLDTLNLSTNANVTQVALALPEAQVEQLINSLQQHKRAGEHVPPAN
jgi:hypothetical protein